MQLTASNSVGAANNSLNIARSSFTVVNPSNSVLPQAPLNTAEGTEEVSEVVQTARTSVLSHQRGGGY